MEPNSSGFLPETRGLHENPVPGCDRQEWGTHALLRQDIFCVDSVTFIFDPLFDFALFVNSLLKQV